MLHNSTTETSSPATPVVALASHAYLPATSPTSAPTTMSYEARPPRLCSLPAPCLLPHLRLPQPFLHPSHLRHHPPRRSLPLLHHPRVAATSPLPYQHIAREPSTGSVTPSPIAAL